MKPLRRIHDSPDDLRKRIAAARAARKGYRDLEQRLVIATCWLIRKAVRQERKAAG